MSETKDLNFKVDPLEHQAFKITAAFRGITMKELMAESYRCWLAAYADGTLLGLLPDKFKHIEKVQLRPRSDDSFLDC